MMNITVANGEVRVQYYDGTFKFDSYYKKDDLPDVKEMNEAITNDYVAVIVLRIPGPGADSVTRLQRKVGGMFYIKCGYINIVSVCIGNILNNGELFRRIEEALLELE
jgi:hypothetical protein